MKITNLNKPQSIKDYSRFKENYLKRYKGMESLLRERYNLDILEDLVMCQANKIICFADLSKKKLVLEVIAGSFELLGFEDVDHLELDTLLSYFDFQNGYAKVAGEKAYYNNITILIDEVENEPNVTFPLVNEKGRHWIRFNLIPHKEKPGFATVFITDVTNFLVEEEALFVKTHHDSLTNTFNKYTFDYHYGLRYHNKDFHVLYFDIDDFKVLNDRYGHHKGNEFLVDFANLLLSYETDENRFYRIGGDEFVGLFFQKEESIKAMAEAIIRKTDQMTKEKYPIPITVSIGIVKAEARDDVISKADQVLYKAKANGKNQYLYFNESEL